MNEENINVMFENYQRDLIIREKNLKMLVEFNPTVDGAIDLLKSTDFPLFLTENKSTN